MLSYRHGFHAGNFADVLKHSMLALAINEMKQKEKPFVYIDTHAGAGRYSFKSGFAEKTGEYEFGISQVWAQPSPPPELQSYLAAVRAENTGRRLVRYPGSPQLAKRLLRAQDRLQLSELHSGDYESLQRLFAGDKQVSVAKEDGLARLLKKLPPIQKRGLILIDPSYEVKSDYQTVVETLEKAHRRFATGVYALWYPVIERHTVDRLMLAMQTTGIIKQLRIEHCIVNDGAMRGMTGSGMLFINPPWRLQQQAESLLPWLNQVLTDGQGTYLVDWLVPESG